MGEGGGESGQYLFYILALTSSPGYQKLTSEILEKLVGLLMLPLATLAPASTEYITYIKCMQVTYSPLTCYIYLCLTSSHSK